MPPPQLARLRLTLANLDAAFAASRHSTGLLHHLAAGLLGQAPDHLSPLQQQFYQQRQRRLLASVMALCPSEVPLSVYLRGFADRTPLEFSAEISQLTHAPPALVGELARQIQAETTSAAELLSGVQCQLRRQLLLLAVQA